MVYDTLKNHAPPHLASAVHRECGRQQGRVISYALWINVERQVKDLSHSLSDFLGLHRPDDVYSRVIPTTAERLPEFDESEHDAENDSNRGNNFYRRNQIRSIEEAIFHANRS